MDDALRDRPRDLLIAGHVNVDEFLQVAAFPGADRTAPVVRRRTELGGPATNIALTASRYGVACGLVTRLGAGFPDGLRAMLTHSSIDLRGVEYHPRRTTPTCYIVEDERHAQRTFIDQGAMADGAPIHFRLGPWLKEYAWLHATTGPPAAILGLQTRARTAGLHVAVDPAQEVHYRWDAPSLRRLVGHAELLWGNRSEIGRMLGVLNMKRPEELLALVPLVIRTEGTHGSTAFSRAETVHVPAKKPRTLRTVVGAGDAYRGGFYAAWFAGQRLRECLTAGQRAATRWLEGAR
jgi:sugar/nucleoside kinase (ribokinase family)